MADSFLLPEDVSSANAIQVLAFLNSAESAEQVDAAIEIPEQSDIGPQLARRLIERRDELGQFSSLDQVYATPFIGPRRFTQIVVSLSAQRPPRGGRTGADPTLLNLLSDRIDALEQKLHPQSSIRLSAINPDALLGQESKVLAEVRSAEGEPLIDHPVTFVTTWGVLRGRHGLQPVSGNSITVRSDHLGLCKVHLHAALGENLSLKERDNLTHALTLLGEAEGSPRDNLNGLTALARQYRAAGNDMLRKAIDTLSKRYADSALQDAPVDSLARWPFIPVTVFAMLPPEPDATSTAAPGSMINLQQRNWFYAWLWAFGQLLERESQLGASLSDVNTGERSGRGVLADLYNRVDSFVSTQHGVIGRQLGERFAADRLNGFLTNGLKGVSADERTRVLVGTSSGAGALKSTRSFSTLSSSRAELQLDVDAGVSNAATTTDARITNLQNSINVELKGKADRSALTDLGTQLDERLDNKADVNQLEALQGALNTGLAGKANISDIESLQKDFNTKLGSKANTSDLDTLRRDFDEKLATRADLSRMTELENRLDGKADATRLTQLEQELTTTLDSKADKTALTELSKGIDTKLANKADNNALNRVEQEFNTKLDSKADATRFATLETQLDSKADKSVINELSRNVDSKLATKADNTRVNTLQNEMKSGLESKADKSAVTERSKDVDARLATKADATTVAKLDRDVSALNTRTNTISTDLTKLDTRVKTVDQRVDGLGRNRPGPVIRR